MRCIRVLHRFLIGSYQSKHEGTISVFLSLKGTTESRDVFINALRNGTFYTHLLKKLTLFFFLNRTFKVVHFRYFIAFNIVIYLTF